VSSIRKDLPAGEALRRHMRKALKALAADLSAALEGAGVHAARKRLKLSRSLLRMMEPALGETVFAREDGCLQEASHALAGLRRNEAMLEAIGKLAASRGAASTAVLEALTQAIRHMQASNTDAGSLPERIATALERIETLRGRLADWPLPKRDIRPLVAGMRASYARARKKLREGLDQGRVTLLHEARKSIIHHYHHLDLLKPLWPKLLTIWLTELQDLREALGDLNDLDELEGLLAEGAIALPDKVMEQAALKLIAARRKALIGKIGSDTGHLFAEKPSFFAARMAALWEQWLA
jgi:CHAD domain-containing protein